MCDYLNDPISWIRHSTTPYSEDLQSVPRYAKLVRGNDHLLFFDVCLSLFSKVYIVFYYSLRIFITPFVFSIFLLGNNIFKILIMINKQDLIKLGYNKKGNRILGKAISEDFRFGEAGEREYLVNLSESGVVTVDFAINIANDSTKRKRNLANVTSLEEFIAWHNPYEV